MTIADTYAPSTARTWHTAHVTDADIPAARRWARTQLADLNIHPDTAYDAAVVISELLTNVLHHAPGPAEITLDKQGHLLVVSCADRGPDPILTLTATRDDEHHRGMTLVDGLSSGPHLTRKRALGGKRAYVLFDLDAIGGKA